MQGLRVLEAPAWVRANSGHARSRHRRRPPLSPLGTQRPGARV